MIRRLALLLVAGAAVGAVAGWGVAQLGGSTYRAAAVLHVLPAGVEPLGPEGRVAAEVQAASYARLLSEPSFLGQIRAQVAGGALSVEELRERIRGRHEGGTALVEVAGEAPTQQAARGLASDVSSALLGYVRQTARQRAAQVEDELRRRIEAVGQEIADAAGSPARVEALRDERARLNQRLAATATDAVEEGTRLVLAGPATPEEDAVGAPPGLGAAVGGAVGVLAALVVALVVAPRRRAAPRAAAQPTTAPEPEPGPEPQAAPALVEPAPGAVLVGAVPLRTAPAGVPVEVSRDGSSWTELAGEGAWDTATVEDGRYLLRAGGSDEAVPVEIDNVPPTVRMEPPAPEDGVYRLRADAEDAGSGVASVTFMVSDGSAEWTEIPADWRPPAPALWWVCAVATDRAGHRAASEPVAVDVDSL